MNRVTADSNILISAFLRGGKPLEFVELARAGRMELAISNDILNETGRVLATKFRVPAQDIQEYHDEIRTFAKLIVPDERLDVVKADPSDNPIVKCAVAAGSDTIITGDGHLLAIENFRGIKIQRVSDFLQNIAIER